MNFLKMAIAGFILIASTLTVTAGSDRLEELMTPTVEIKTSLGGCSGVHFGQGRVLTAAHCFSSRLRKQEDMFVEIDGQRGTLQWIDRSMDVAEVRYLSGAVLPRAAKLECAAPVDLFDEVIAVGYPSDLGEVKTRGEIARLPAKTSRWEMVYIHTASTAPGSSGGPMFNLKGDVVGIVVGGFTGYVINIGVPVTYICPRISRSLEMQ